MIWINVVHGSLISEPCRPESCCLTVMNAYSNCIRHALMMNGVLLFVSLILYLPGVLQEKIGWIHGSLGLTGPHWAPAIHTVWAMYSKLYIYSLLI